MVRRLLPYLTLLTALALWWQTSETLSKVYAFAVDGAASAVEFSDDGRLLVTRDQAAVEIREARSGRLLRRLERTEKDIRSGRAAGDYVVLETWNAALRSNQVRAYGIATGEPVTELLPGAEPLLDWALDPEGRWLAVATSDRYLLVDLRTGARREMRGSAPSSTACVRFGGERWLFTGSNHHWALYPLAGGPVHLECNQPGWQAGFSPDGRWLAVAGATGTDFWDLASRRQTGSLPGPARVIDFSPDSRTVALSPGPRRHKDRQGWADSSELTLVRAPTWQTLLTGHVYHGSSVRFSQDSASLLTYRNAKKREEPIQLWVSVLSSDGKMLAHRYYPEGFGAAMGPAGHVAVELFSAEPYRAWTEVLRPGLGAAVGSVSGGRSAFHPRESRFWLASGRNVEVWQVTRR